MTRAFDNKVVVISGAVGGIGRLACEAFAASGASVVGTDRDVAQGRLLEAELRSKFPTFTFHPADVGDPQEIVKLAALLSEGSGRVDILVNNAGVLGVSNIIETSVEEWDRLQNINLRSVFLMTKAVAPLLTDGSVILNMSSSAALTATPGTAAYSVSKAGIVAFSKIAAAELAPRTRVNVVCPGPLDTPMPHSFLKDHPQKDQIMGGMIDSTLLKRLGKPEEIVDLLMFLASSKAGYITGSVFSADGGFG